MDFKQLVRVEEGLVSRRIFTDSEIYELELEQIFARCWLFLGHVSQLKEKGDYFTTYMGEDSVLVTRNLSGKVRAFLNSCRHRGTRLCRSDHGNRKSFACPYHGWTYSNEGKLIGVPDFEGSYYGELDKDKWGLLEVAHLDTFGGLIFATWDPDAEPLREYLGDFTGYLDYMLNRLEGGVEVIGGVEKWRIPTNWKIVADNTAGDSYHVPITHGSIVDIGYRKRAENKGHQISTGGGHGFGSQAGGIQPGDAAQTAYAKFLTDLRERVLAERGHTADKFIPLGHGLIFPNLSLFDSARLRMVRVIHPRGPWEVEHNTYCLVDKALPEELKAVTRRDFVLSFGPNGIQEQEDGEIFSLVAESLRGHVARRLEFNYQMGLGHEQLVKDVYGGELAGRMGRFWSEINQREFYRRWRELMMMPVGK